MSPRWSASPRLAPRLELGRGRGRGPGVLRARLRCHLGDLSFGEGTSRSERQADLGVPSVAGVPRRHRRSAGPGCFTHGWVRRATERVQRDDGDVRTSPRRDFEPPRCISVESSIIKPRRGHRPTAIGGSKRVNIGSVGDDRVETGRQRCLTADRLAHAHEVVHVEYRRLGTSSGIDDHGIVEAPSISGRASPARNARTSVAKSCGRSPWMSWAAPSRTTSRASGSSST